MTTDDRRPLTPPDPVDPLALAEAVAAGRLTILAAEAALREAHLEDPRRAESDVDELHDLVAAIRGIRRHVHVTRQADGLDPNGVGAPVATGRELEDDREVAPRRVRPGDVRLRPPSRQRTPRWAPVGALAAAAVLVVGVALIVPGLLVGPVATSPSPTANPIVLGSPSASVPASPSASPSAIGSPTPTPSPTPSPTPAPTGVPGVPPIPSEPLAGAPVIVTWTLATESRIAVSSWAADGSAPTISFTASTWADPSRAAGIWIDRRVVASADGRRVAFAETDTQPPYRQRLRIFAADGTLLWTDPKPTGLPDLAWSPDGSELVVGSQPATWKILTFPTGGGAPTVVTRDFPGAAYRVIGFSASGAVLYGWDTTGEADFWSSPFQIVSPNGKVLTIKVFSGKSDPLGVSNGTTPATEVAPENGTSTQAAGVDPLTGKVLDTGDLSGLLNGWEVRDGTARTDGSKLKGLTMDMALAWGPAGSIVVADVNQSNIPATVTTVAASAPGAPLTPVFSIAKGSYWRLFEGCRGGYALLGMGADRAHDAPYLGADELVMIDLATGRTAVGFLGHPGLTGIHIAGWITAP